MEKVLNIYKPAGMTPLETVKAFQAQHPEYRDVKISYAGRLDPLAEGVLLVLVGDELKKQKKYWGLDKEYEANILLGFSTDTYDVLGMSSFDSAKPSFKVPRSDFSSENPPLRSRQKTPKGDQAFLAPRATLNEVLLRKVLSEFKGEYTFSFPPYSSKRVEGKPLFWWARNGRLDEIDIPQKTVKIHKIELRGEENIKNNDLLDRVVEKIDSVGGDFRQKEIKEAWKNTIGNANSEKFPVLNISISCSSGTYIRSIAHDMGKKMGTGAVLLNLKRTRVGKYEIKNSVKV